MEIVLNNMRTSCYEYGVRLQYCLIVMQNNDMIMQQNDIGDILVRQVNDFAFLNVQGFNNGERFINLKIMQ